jgi:succinoglycan biosynthesis protein ExoM
MAPDISICVATYRRPRGLGRLLESLARLKLPEGVAIEIVVVDNDAAASAAPVVAEWAAGPHPLRACVEPRANVSRARNRAVAEARGRWLAFIDDDEVAHESWIAAYWERLERDGWDGWFGPVLPRLEEPGPDWLDPEIFFARPRHASGSRVGLEDARTSNAILRRGLFEGCAFDPAHGRSEGHAEDTELFGRMLVSGARFGWCDEAVVSEWIPAERHRFAWLAKRAYFGGVVWTRLARRRDPVACFARDLPRALLASAVLALGLPAAALLGRREAARAGLRLCVQAGHLRAFAAGGASGYNELR